MENLGLPRLSMQFSVLAALLLCGFLSEAAPPTYRLTDVGDLDGRSSYARGINNLGHVVGASPIGDTGTTHAFVYRDGSIRDLGTLGGYGSAAFDINDAGDIVGFAYVETAVTSHAFLYRDGDMTDLGPPVGGNSTAYGVNSAGIVVGEVNFGGYSGGSRAFRFENGTMLDLGRFGGESAAAVAINTDGVITGYYNERTDVAVYKYAFVYSNGATTPIGTFGGDESVAYDINDNGVVVGYAYTAMNQRAHAFRYSNGSLEDLGTLPGDLHSTALGINNLGQIVGAAEYGSGSNARAVLWHEGAIYNLNDLVSASDPLRPYVRLFHANAINESGQIAANGVDSRTGLSRAYLLTPAAVPKAVRFDFSMTITETMTLPPIAQVGDVVSGSLVFDSLAPDSNPSAAAGSYPLTSLVVTYSGITETATGGRINVMNDANCTWGVCDSYVVLADFGSYSPYPSPHTFYFFFDDYSATLLNSDSLPLAPPVSSGLTGSVLVNADGAGGLWPANGVNTLNLSLHDESALSVDLTLSGSLVAGCKSVSGRLTLSSPAPAGGAIATISDTLTAATPPATVKIAEGATSKSFTIMTVPVATNQSGTVTASLGGASSSQPLTIRPMGLSAVKLSPSTVVGGKDTTGTVTLECAAGPGPVTVDLSTSNVTVASPVAPTVVVPQGLKSRTFTVATNPVFSKSSAMITGEASTTTKARRLNVLPAAVVTPAKLGFGIVSVGQTSGELGVILRNDGVVPIAVSSISLTGSYASWFAQTHNCPANLAAGASCTISVTFTPQAALSKSAKLSIVTSATSTPLSVSLSGTGI